VHNLEQFKKVEYRFKTHFLGDIYIEWLVIG